MKYIQTFEANIANSIIQTFQTHKMAIREWNKLMGAIVFNDFEYFSNYINSGEYNLEDTDNQGNTALLLASIHGRLEMLKVLVDAGVNIYHENDNGENFYDIACNRKMKRGFKFINKTKDWIEEEFPQFVMSKKYNL